MAHYIAIIEDAGPDHAVGVWFPDLPGCTSAGDDIDEALRNKLPGTSGTIWSPWSKCACRPTLRNKFQLPTWRIAERL
jgi:HicB_like antitoxin of bacterial toxin-antitoxin system